MTEQASGASEGGAAESAGGPVAIEETARRMGWKPKEEYKGPEERWKPAAEFVEHGLNELPVLRDRYRSLDERYNKELREANERAKKTEEKVSELQHTLTEYVSFASKNEERAYKRALKDLEAQRDAAVAHADTETFRKTQAEIDALNETVRATPAPKPETPAKPTEQNAAAVDPYAETWVSENSWFNEHQEMQGFAIGLHNRLLKNEPTLSLRDNLAKVREEVQKRFPERFENQRRSAPAAVSDAAPASQGRKTKKSYADLPADAKAACDKFVKQIPGFSKEEYCRQYFGGEE